MSWTCVRHPGHEDQSGRGRVPAPADRRPAARPQIRRGDWAAGERLPSIPAMAEMFGVAKQTVQRTVDQLRVEGMLITKPGSGTYVRGTRRRLNRLSRGRYGAHRGYHADLAARYRQQLDLGRPGPRAARGRRRVRRPRRHRAAGPPAPGAHRGRPGRGRRLLVPGRRRRRHQRWSGPRRSAGRSTRRSRRHRPPVRHRDRHDQRPAAHPRGGGDPADPAGHAGAAPAARGVRRGTASRSRWPRRPGRAR